MLPKPLSWDEYFLSLAVVTSLRSKDPSTKTGALFVDSSNRIISTGYNGFPAGTDYPEEFWTNRELKYNHVIHAEMNALIGALKNGKSLEGSTCYVTWTPCKDCAKHLAAAGVQRIVALPTPDALLERWKDSFEVTYEVFMLNRIQFDTLELNPLQIKRFINGEDHL
jgi:dCMP deaminase